jgi:small subunit ribosomal protein S6
MANQNAVENSLATTTDADQQGEIDAPVADSNVTQSAPQETAQPQAPARTQGELVDALQPAGEAGEQKEVLNGRPYEIVFIVRTTHGNEIESITNRAKELVESNGGAVDNVRTSDVRRFSYPISKEVEGSYIVLNARFTTGTVAELDRFFKLEEGVLRHLVVREDI